MSISKSIFVSGECRGIRTEVLYSLFISDSRLSALEQLIRRSLVKETKSGNESATDSTPSNSPDNAATVEVRDVSKLPVHDSDPPSLAIEQLRLFPNDKDGTLYVGGTAWDSVFTAIDELRSFVQKGVDSVDSMATQKDLQTLMMDRSQFSLSSHNKCSPQSQGPVTTPPHTLSFPLGNAIPLQELLNLVPPTNLATAIMDRYFSSTFLFSKIVHRATFMNQYQEFLSSPTNVNLSWLALLFSVLLSGILSLSPSEYIAVNDSHLTQEEMQQRLYDGTKSALFAAEFMKSHSLSVVQALAILQHNISADDTTGISTFVHC